MLYNILKGMVCHFANELFKCLWAYRSERKCFRIFEMVRMKCVLKWVLQKVLVKTRGTHFNLLLLLDSLLIQVLNIVVDKVLLVLLLQVMMAQEERGPMMVDTRNDGGDIADP